ncbi:MAG: hypothetical protein HY744_20630 [Deltaproteobacteria bacterium]|nr:hypothetical protein [Deltaproteobacteria bacterium]
MPQLYVLAGVLPQVPAHFAGKATPLASAPFGRASGYGITGWICYQWFIYRDASGFRTSVYKSGTMSGK